MTLLIEQPNVAEQDEGADAGSGRKLDAELKAIGGMVRTLDGMDAVARRRVLAYLGSRYGEQNQ